VALIEEHVALMEEYVALVAAVGNFALCPVLILGVSVADTVII
jgi:hypothetical protein